MKPFFNLGLLLDMLTYRRPAGSSTETAFNDRYIATLPGVTRDRFGNWHCTIGDSPILWSTHTDTVHNAGGRQTVSHDTRSGLISVSRKSKRGRVAVDRSNCLGADDTAGVFLAVSMIREGVAGHYVFHYGEEIGGQGSADLADLEPETIAASRFAIALDRKGYCDVITHQGLRTCSDAFADSLAQQLNKSGLAFKASDRGLFTDTANYTEVIGECTNLSIGYQDAHSRSETVDASFLRLLLTALCNVDASALIAERQAGEVDHTSNWGKPASFRQSLLGIPGMRAYDTICEYCGSPFDPFRSWADEVDKYCTAECETADYREIAKRLDRTYLDPVYADVARALLGQTKGKA